MTEDRRSYDPWAAPPASLTGVVQPPAAADEPKPAAAEPKKSAPDDGLDDLKKAELVAMADDLGVDSSGNKADIIARLRAL